MTKYILITLLIIVTILGFDCKKNPIVPPLQDGADTTSHNWVFTIDTLGEGNGSVLNDAAIVSTNPPLVYAVGEIYLKDSTGQFDQQPYSIAKWEGKNWELKKLFYNNNLPVAPIRGILIFNNDFWLAAGSVFHWDGNSSIAQLVYSRLTFGGTVEKLWGTSNNQIYGVGIAGTIVHYDGSNWQKIPSGTGTDIQDIWGYQNISGQTTILSISSTVFYGGTENVLSISGNNVTQLNTNGLSWSIRGIWFDGNGYYIGGAEIYYKKSLQDSLWQIVKAAPSNSYGYINAIRGNASNDIVAVGAFGTFLHYNGSSWYNFTQQLNLSGCDFYSVSIKDNLVVAVGTLGGDRAIAIVGVRK